MAPVCWRSLAQIGAEISAAAAAEAREQELEQLLSWSSDLIKLATSRPARVGRSGTRIGNSPASSRHRRRRRRLLRARASFIPLNDPMDLGCEAAINHTHARPSVHHHHQQHHHRQTSDAWRATNERGHTHGGERIRPPRSPALAAERRKTRINQSTFSCRRCASARPSVCLLCRPNEMTFGSRWRGPKEPPALYGSG